MCAVEMKKESLPSITGQGYSIQPHPKHNRLYHIELEEHVIDRFLEEVKDITDEKLEYIPYQRLIVAHTLLLNYWMKISEKRSVHILNDRNSGGFTIGLRNPPRQMLRTM